MRKRRMRTVTLSSRVWPVGVGGFGGGWGGLFNMGSQTFRFLGTLKGVSS